MYNYDMEYFNLYKSTIQRTLNVYTVVLRVIYNITYNMLYNNIVIKVYCTYTKYTVYLSKLLLVVIVVC